MPVHSELFRNVHIPHSSSMKPSNLNHFFLIQLYIRGFHASECPCFCGLRKHFASCLSAFSHFISGVFGACSQEQMSGVAAWRVITSVTHTKSFWNWTISKFPCKAMRSLRCTIDRFFKSKNTITLWHSTFRPRPAFVWAFFINVVPKPSYILFYRGVAFTHINEIDRRFRSKARTVLAATEQTVVKCFELTQFLMAALKPSLFLLKGA